MPPTSFDPRQLLRPVKNLWARWIEPQATGRVEAFRERSLRGITVIAGLGFAQSLVNAIAILDVPSGFAILYGLFGLIPILAALFAVTRQRLVLSAWLVQLSVLLMIGFLSLTLGYWSAWPIINSFFALMIASITLPRRQLPLAIGLVFLAISGMILVQAIMGTQPQVRPIDPLFAPGQAVMAMAFVLLLLMGFGQYIVREFDKRLSDVTEMVDTLEERVADRTRELNVSRQESDRLYILGQAINEKITYNNILEAYAEAFPDRDHDISLAVYDDFEFSDGKDLRFVGWVGQDGRPEPPADLVLPPLPVATEEHPFFIIESLDTETRLGKRIVNLFTELEIRSMLVRQIAIGERICGAIAFLRDTSGAFTERDKQRLLSLSDLSAGAIERSRLLATAEQARSEAELANSIKSRYLATMSHELRTPLNAMINFNQFVSTGIYGSVNEQQVDALAKSTDSARHLLALINEVLDISKIETGQLELNIETNIDLQSELNVVAKTIGVLIDPDRVSLSVDVEVGIPTVSVDKLRIRQVLINIANNAVKFTERGQITFKAYTRETDVVLSVKDTGPGIPLEAQELIFEPFYQVTTDDHYPEGTGLGLAISKRLVEAHGGRLWVKSAPGEGADFMVSLPIRQLDRA